MMTGPIFTFGRPSVDLGGTWKFVPDPMQRSCHQTWWRRHANDESFFPCWDPSGMWDIAVPGTWTKQFEELKWYSGHATYLKDFDAAPPSPDMEAYLCFDGVVYQTAVYLNGQHMGTHDWGYSPFAVRVTDVLAEHNRLFVLVDSTIREDRVPATIFDWFNDGGIINPVRLVFVPRTFVENFRVSTRLEGTETVVRVDVHLASRDARATEDVAVRVPELGLESTILASACAPSTVELRIPRDAVALWRPSNPKLYKVELTTRFETISDDIGLREIRTEGRSILLNGEPLRLYGICVHSEHPNTGRTATPESIDRYVKTAKDLGLNFFRCAHYPYSEAWGRALDREGLMWWEEVPAYWVRNLGDDAMARLPLGMLCDTIRRDWNRASVIIWSVSNECCWRNSEDPSDTNYPYWFEAAALARSLDPSRLISCAEAQNFVQISDGWTPAHGDAFQRKMDEIDSWRPGHSDEWYALFDVLAGNFYVRPGESLASFKRFIDLLRPYNKPLMLSEFGSMSLAGAEVPDSFAISETRHVLHTRDSYDAIRRVADLAGFAPWILVDGRAPIHWRWYNDKRAIYRYGFMTEDWKPKKAYHALKEEIAKTRALLGESG